MGLAFRTGVEHHPFVLDADDRHTAPGRRDEQILAVIDRLDLVGQLEPSLLGGRQVRIGGSPRPKHFAARTIDESDTARVLFDECDHLIAGRCGRIERRQGNDRPVVVLAGCT